MKVFIGVLEVERYDEVMEVVGKGNLGGRVILLMLILYCNMVGISKWLFFVFGLCCMV